MVAIAVFAIPVGEAVVVDFVCFANQYRNAKYARHAAMAANVPITLALIADVSCSICVGR